MMGLAGDRAFLPSLNLMASLCLLAFSSVGPALAEDVSSSPLVCQRPTLQGIILPPLDQCFFYGPLLDRNAAEVISRVLEIQVNGTTLERALDNIQSRSGAYVAVLFYAKCCPFSDSVRRTFDMLSLLYPAIYHFAVEESSLRPSALSLYGVHSFPSLFLHNKTVRVRYYGPRTIEAFGRFYRDVTGVQPLDPRIATEEERSIVGRLAIDEVPQEGSQICPYPWVTSPEKWLQDDMYLTLATLFLILRFCYHVLPKLASRSKHYWVEERYIQQLYKAVVQRDRLPHAEQEQHGISSSDKVDKGKHMKMETLQDNLASGRGALFVPSWSSSTLAPVTLAEGSSGVSDESWETGQTHKGGFWG